MQILLFLRAKFKKLKKKTVPLYEHLFNKNSGLVRSMCHVIFLMQKMTHHYYLNNLDLKDTLKLIYLFNRVNAK